MMADVLFWLAIELLLYADLLVYRGIVLDDEEMAINKRSTMLKRLEVMKRIDEEEKERYLKAES